ncbi:ABC transporter permease subunit [Prauserella cavernicola]|uniref:ABC transporter permease subunit n=1 Tax=Prauserella cavernicola TaxID=2800127 RepID=A0A934QNL1_9PSEU|nr:ABC transporter permease subunit [Prauserella cavernicola]MBK1783800.1 ABC transporter permease subunit [Prauserella cavernicola]
MIWLAWRQHRAALVTAAATFAAFCLALVLLSALELTSPVADPLGLTNNRPADYLGYVLLAGPTLLAALFAAPLLARELEHGTHLFALSQSVSRGRWLTGHLLVGGLPPVLLFAVAAALYHQVVAPGPWYDGMAEGVYGALPLVRGLFALSVGALFGVLARRVLTAATLAGVTVTVVEVLADLVRPYLFAPDVLLHPVTASWSAEVWTLASGYVRGGQLLPDGAVVGCTRDDAACLDNAGITGRWTELHPIGHRVPLHWIECAVYVALALAALALLWRRTRRI